MVLTLLLSIFMGIVLFWKIPFCKSLAINSKLPQLSVIIPARNEEVNLQVLLPSLLAQKMSIHEIIVVDDHSDDRTKWIAEKAGVKVLSLSSLPDGWMGKGWGCWKGAEEATGNILLFLDADTIMEQGGITRLLEYYRKEGGILSLHPYHRMKRPYEFLSSMFHMVIMASIGAFHMFRSKTNSAGAFGQCLVCDREEYFKFDGHSAVKGELLEHMAFGQHVIEQGGKVSCISGKNVISMRMYPNGLVSLIYGWTKSFAKGASATKLIYLFPIIIWINGLVTVSLQFVLIKEPVHLEVIVFFYGLFLLQWYWILSRIGNFGWISALLFPIHVMFFVLVFFSSFLKIFILRSVSWKGRTIQIKKE
ncbi:glycosyltransferase family 2 protein [Bacillus sp. 165]|uniref:glycosyltransferase n=1 Tax=Bacillus sp. 165 TaxID=1529117 RepID=UPI001AD9F7A3|nr:glycosyltransferase family 2 protein [Bacillus sp. 165]MBO9129155.1 glycosyltransferase family 2 protein [Bacillus sp. 165]